MELKEYKKKAVYRKAIQVDNEVTFLNLSLEYDCIELSMKGNPDDGKTYSVKTNTGWAEFSLGDYLVREDDGTWYPIPEEKFVELYDFEVSSNREKCVCCGEEKATGIDFSYDMQGGKGVEIAFLCMDCVSMLIGDLMTKAINGGTDEISPELRDLGRKLYNYLGDVSVLFKRKSEEAQETPETPKLII